MFMTSEAFRQLMPVQLAGDGDAFYKAVLLSNESHFFLLTHRVNEGDLFMFQTLVVSWETTLLSIIERLESTDIVSLSRIEPSYGDWDMRPVSELWIPRDDIVELRGPFLYRTADDNLLRDAFARPLAGPDDSRLLWSRPQVASG